MSRPDAFLLYLLYPLYLTEEAKIMRLVFKLKRGKLTAGC